MKPIMQCLLLIVLVKTCGCYDATAPFSIRGLVLEKEGITGSYSRHSAEAWSDKETPVAGAIVTLSFDPDGKDLVLAPFVTDHEGWFLMNLPRIPSAKNPDRWFYLTVKYKGGEKYTKKLLLGAGSGNSDSCFALLGA